MQHGPHEDFNLIWDIVFPDYLKSGRGLIIVLSEASNMVVCSRVG